MIMKTLNSIKVKINKPTPVDEYLKMRLEEERVPVQPIIEYFCNTCRTNVKLDALDQFEKTREKLTFIPPAFRQVLKDIGIVFTKSSYLFDAHNTNFKDHEWGMFQPEVRPFSKKT